MREVWNVLESGLGAAALNMALDEALLETARDRGVPTLRLYGWREPAATFGYSQRWAVVKDLTPLRPLIRRPTGGGVVPHDHDWTYSVVIPPGHAWHALRARESYRRVHQWVCGALELLGVQAALANAPIPLGPGACFEGAEEGDVLAEQRKVAGAAQRRNRFGLLIQGSVQPPSGCGDREAFHQALWQAGEERLGCEWRRMKVTPSLAAVAERLVAGKYGLAAFHQQR
jgi:lipoate-protein ligase A